MLRYIIRVVNDQYQTRICIPKVIAEETGFNKVRLATIESGKDGTLYIKELKDDTTKKRGLQKNST